MKALFKFHLGEEAFGECLNRVIFKVLSYSKVSDSLFSAVLDGSAKTIGYKKTEKGTLVHCDSEQKLSNT